jgi:uncharacterized membrane protein YkoI
MTLRQFARPVLCALLGVSLFTGAALAKEHEDTATDEAKIMSSTKITLRQAIASAEQATAGKAVGAGIEDQDGTVHFEVTVLKDGTRQKVLVDIQSGQVVKSVAAADDDGDDD